MICRPSRLSRLEGFVVLEPHMGKHIAKHADTSQPTATTQVSRTVKFRVRGKQPPRHSRWKGRRVQIFGCRIMCSNELVHFLHATLSEITRCTQDMGCTSMAEGCGQSQKKSGLGRVITWWCRPEALQAACRICFCNHDFHGLFSRWRSSVGVCIRCSADGDR